MSLATELQPRTMITIPHLNAQFPGLLAPRLSFNAAIFASRLVSRPRHTRLQSPLPALAPPSSPAPTLPITSAPAAARLEAAAHPPSAVPGRLSATACSRPPSSRPHPSACLLQADLAASEPKSVSSYSILGTYSLSPAHDLLAPTLLPLRRNPSHPSARCRGGSFLRADAERKSSCGARAPLPRIFICVPCLCCASSANAFCSMPFAQTRMRNRAGGGCATTNLSHPCPLTCLPPPHSPIACCPCTNASQFAGRRRGSPATRQSCRSPAHSPTRRDLRLVNVAV
ncbi:hypothetical protein C8R43DRAFT_1018391 [Mycena crocata]|nr:hypothetical protein C8R43DRAFT_1046596 [Mycena crocata]KAJ7140327.1 hypothetical protein C8R43DRAFT_1018391 [Mycena crocata]